MHLKKLELQGFKSFPEYTLIEFDQGMTAVVGPNGSGKSNVTDAIRWVLGEQSVKSLRGGKMEDVIFNGTQSRKAMNYAEVSLTLDNSDRYVDIDYSEIQVTRRLYRSGESEYQINHVNCRLKDIVRLFLDTGLGKDGYSIVGQGRVDEILSTKSEDRRRVIEEASGITKFKVRKEEAERKLNSTEQNLIRIDDIVGEISERIEPLKEQAAKAETYHKSYESLKENDIALLLRTIDDANKAMGDSASVKDQLEAEIKTQEDRYLELRGSNKDLTDKAERLEIEIEEKRQELSDLTEELHDVSSDRKIDEERLRAVKAKIEDNKAEEQKISEEISESEKLLAQRTEEADKLLFEAEEKEKKAEELANTRNELLEQHKASEMSSDKLKKDIENKNTELSEAREQIASKNSQIESIDERIRESINNESNASAILKELDTKKTETDKAWRELMSQEGDVTSDISEREEKIKAVKTKGEKLLARYDAANKKFFSDKSKLRTLTDLEKRKEGYSESVRRLLNSVESDPSYKRKIYGVVGDLISTDHKYETAIETALGAAIHNVVTDTEQEASDLIGYLKNNRLGRVTFLPIENIEPRSLDPKVLSSAKKEKGFIGTADSLVECDLRIRDIISNLLGKIIICDDLDCARTIARGTHHSVKVISLEGDSINPGGSLTGGSIRKEAAGILGRGREIEELQKSVIDQEQQLSIMEAERQQLDEQEGDLKREIAQLEEQLKYFSLERVKAESEYKNISDRISEINDNISDHQKNIEELSSQKIRLQEDIEELETIISEVAAELTDYREDIEKNDTRAREFTEKLDKLRDQISEGRSARDSILAQRNGIMALADHIRSEIHRKEYSLEALRGENDENKNTSEELVRAISNADARMEVLRKKADNLSEKISELNASKAETDKSLSGFLEKMESINDTINSLREKHSSLVIKYDKYITAIDVSKNRLWEDYETTYDNVKGKYPEVTNIAETTKIVNSLKNKIRSLGPVNIAAIEEYKEISERYEFLMAQRNDIAEAKANLESVIADLVEEMRKQFTEQFSIINANFKQVFTDLFGGGNAEIILEDESDVLSCNIEIKAQPPGKKLQNLTLLSGGERCLTAIALLFAILSLRPSPFVVLDEVEAALDDVNISRFTDFVRRYTVRSQFILVTHRKGTMEACDRMYGVTMQERGISKILSMRIQ
ncbi:MAG: chromosome segregation protein SMC [Clostridiales bacterium]|nr:chromosome segregation protein SMC [Clostridiales bacterium]